MKTRLSICIPVIALLLGAAPAASASPISIGAGAFGPGSTLTTFGGESFGTEVNGLTVDGILFGYSLGNGKVVIGVGIGPGANVSAPSVVSASASGNSGVLSMLLPSYSTRFGFGFQLDSTSSLANAVTISIFDGATLLGSLAYGGSPDSVYTGGFAGIESSFAFNKVQVVFNSVDAQTFVLDNIRTESVPEPATLLLLGTGLAAAVAGMRRSKRA